MPSPLISSGVGYAPSSNTERILGVQETQFSRPNQGRGGGIQVQGVREGTVLHFHQDHDGEMGRIGPAPVPHLLRQPTRVGQVVS